MNQLISIILFALFYISHPLHALLENTNLSSESIEEADTFGNVTAYIRDEKGRLVEVIYPPVLTVVDLDDLRVIQFRESYCYDERGNLIEHCDANGDPLIISYDAQDNPITIQYADGTFELFTYFEDGTPQSLTNRSGTKKEYRKNDEGEISELWIIDREGSEQKISLNHMEEDFAPYSTKLQQAGGSANKGELNNREFITEDTETSNALGQTVRQLKVTGGDYITTYLFNAMGRLEKKFLEDREGNEIGVETFYYDGNGNCIWWKKESEEGVETVRNYFGTCSRIEKSIENLGTPNETITHYLYNEYGEPVWTDSTKECCQEDPYLDRHTPSSEDTYSNERLESDPPSDDSTLYESAIDYITQIASLPEKLIHWFKMPDPSDPDSKNEISWLRWSLNHFLAWREKNLVGVIGKGELGDHVRITFLNGMLNYSEEVLEYLETLSEMHGGANVHFVFRETNGFFRDVIKAGLVKAGYVTDHAKELAAVWRKMIEEMGGTDAGGTIIHYAHSLGAADTYVAGGLLTEDERMMIKVYTFGSPQIIPPGYFQEVNNYISRWDGVCPLGPYNYIKALLFKEPHVIFLDSNLGIPFQDHLISSPTYSRIITGLSSGIVTHYGPLVQEEAK